MSKNDFVFDQVLLGRYIRAHRLQNHLTQAQLAEKTLCQISYLSRVENGVQRPSLELLFRLAAVLKMSLDDLIHLEADSLESRVLWRKLAEMPPSTKQLLVVLLKDFLNILAT